MSEIAQIRNLDGHPAAFVRFDGPEQLVVAVDGELRIVARAYWVSLPIYQGEFTISTLFPRAKPPYLRDR
jgi:hypothetical protein